MRIVPGLAIEQAKLTNYLLDLSHPEGGSKAKFFLSHGFRIDAPETLADQLAAHAELFWPGRQVVTPNADKRVLVGPIETPNGDRPTILSVWQVKADGLAWFVTARPHR